MNTTPLQIIFYGFDDTPSFDPIRISDGNQSSEGVTKADLDKYIKDMNDIKDSTAKLTDNFKNEVDDIKDKLDIPSDEKPNDNGTY